MQNILINITTKPIKSKHVCFYTEYDYSERKYILYEILDVFYEHPDSDGMGLIQQKEHKRITSLKRYSQQALMLLENAQNNIYNIL